MIECGWGNQWIVIWTLTYLKLESKLVRLKEKGTTLSVGDTERCHCCRWVPEIPFFSMGSVCVLTNSIGYSLSWNTLINVLGIHKWDLMAIPYVFHLYLSVNSWKKATPMVFAWFCSSFFSLFPRVFLPRCVSTGTGQMQSVEELGVSPEFLLDGCHLRGCWTGKLRGRQCLHGCLDVQVPSAAQSCICRSWKRWIKDIKGSWRYLEPLVGEYDVLYPSVGWLLEGFVYPISCR